MFLNLLLSFKKNDFQVFLILFFVLLSAYTPLFFLGYSYGSTWDSTQYTSFRIAREQTCVENCGNPFAFVLDSAANGIGSWPLLQTTVNMYSEGILPLWNPYLLAGYPMFAETTNLNFSPLIIFYFVPQAFWDISVLVSLLLVGIFTYYLLRSWKLHHVSSLSGSIIFMLSGPFTWYLTHANIPVIIFMPLILYSIERVFQKREIKFVIIGSLAFTASILGTHLESIVLVFMMVLFFLVFRIIIFLKTEDIVFSKKNSIGQIFKKIPILHLLIIIVVGIGMASFFILPGLEFISEGALFRQGTSVGSRGQAPFEQLSTLFIPNVVGPIHEFISIERNSSWHIPIGYVVASSLVFSIIGLSNHCTSNFHRWIARFFLGISVLFILKSVGLPGLNELGYLPVLEHILFPRYSIFIITFGLAISASVGIDSLIKNSISLKKLGIVTGIAITIILSLVMLLMPYYSPQYPNDELYMPIQILTAIIFVLFSSVFVLMYQKKLLNSYSIIVLIILEAILYVPMGLPPEWQVYKSVPIIIGICAIIFIAFLNLRKKSLNEKNLFLKIIFVFIIIITLHQIVFIESPSKLPIREQIFSENEPIEFLKNNLDNHRILSFDGAFLPNYPSAFNIQALGGLSAMNTQSFHQFKEFVDPYANAMSFNYGGQRSCKSPTAECTFDNIYYKNKQLFDFMGVKYILSFNTDPGLPKFFTNIHKVMNINDDSERLIQEFTFNVNSSSSIGVWLGDYGVINSGDVILELDSIPPQDSYHRIATINAEDAHRPTIFQFEKLDNIYQKKFQLKLYHLEYSQNNKIAVSTAKIDEITPVRYGIVNPELYIDGTKSNKFIPIAVQQDFPLVFDGITKIFESKDVFPRAFTVSKYQIINSPSEIFKTLQYPSFDLRNEVIFENFPPEKYNVFDSMLTLNQDSEVEIIKYSPNYLLIHVDQNHPSILILTDTFYPGWHAYVDGKESKIMKANGLVRAVFVPSGSHTVEFTFLPQSFIYGILISVISAVALIIIGIINFRKPRFFQKHSQKFLE